MAGSFLRQGNPEEKGLWEGCCQNTLKELRSQPLKTAAILPLPHFILLFIR
jgi:hypothetical protein